MYTGTGIVPGHTVGYRVLDNGCVAKQRGHHVALGRVVCHRRRKPTVYKSLRHTAVFDGWELERFLDYSIKAIDHRPRVEPPSLNGGGLVPSLSRGRCQ